MPLEGFWLHVAEGVLRLSLFVGYLALIGRLSDMKRVFQYHGAEHKAIAAYENDVEVTPESAQRFTTEHVRCGTNFLLTVMVVTIVVYAFVGRPGWVVADRVAASCSSRSSPVSPTRSSASRRSTWTSAGCAS